MSKSIFPGVIVASLLAACQTSPAPSSVPRATGAYGDSATIMLRNNRRVGGELLAVTDSAWYLLVNNRVGALRTESIAFVTVHEYRTVRSRRPRLDTPAGPLDARTAQHAREGARFPFGIPAPAMAALLAKTSQSSPDDLEKTPQ